jgi:putative ABC transport system permease protein
LNAVNRSFETVLGISTVLAFLLSGLGLFGLATFEIERRTKEIGIRKALGAASAQIVLHFLKGFSKLIALANLIAWPLTFLLIRLVFALIEYPRPLVIGPLIFVEVGAVSFAVMAVTVGAQTLRAASLNPVQTLRYE